MNNSATVLFFFKKKPNLGTLYYYVMHNIIAKTAEQIPFLRQVLQQLWWHKLLIDYDYYDCNNSSHHAVVSTSINIQCFNMKTCLNTTFADNKRERCMQRHTSFTEYYSLAENIQKYRRHTKVHFLTVVSSSGLTTVCSEYLLNNINRNTDPIDC